VALTGTITTNEDYVEWIAIKPKGSDDPMLEISMTADASLIGLDTYGNQSTFLDVKQLAELLTKITSMVKARTK
jgi:hypothetical protein